MANTKDKKKRFNFVDVILLVFVLALLTTLGYLVVSAYNTHFLTDAQGTVIEYKIVVENVDNEVNCGNIAEGDSVIEIETLSTIGKVVSYEEKPSAFVAPDTQGNAVKSDNPLEKDVTLVIRAEGSGSKTTYDLGSYTVSVGKDINFRVPGFTAVGECVSVEVIKGE